MLNEIELFFDEMRINKKSETTITDYKTSITFFVNYFNIENIEQIKNLKYLDFSQFNKYLNIERKLTDRTRAKRLSAIRVFLEFLKKINIIDVNFMEKIENPKFEIDTEIEIVDTEDIQKFLYHFRNCPKKLLILRILASTGIRISELLNLEIENIKETYIRVLGKGNKYRNVPITLNLYNKIQEYILNDRKQNKILSIENFKKSKYLNKFKGDSIDEKYNKFLKLIEDSKNLLFLSQNNIKMDTANIGSMFKTAAKKLNICKKVTPHQWRHFYCTTMLDNNAPLRIVSKNMGHSSVMVTSNIYDNLSDKRRIEDSIPFLQNF